MKRIFKYGLACMGIVILLFGVSIWRWNQNQSSYELKLLTFKKVSQVENFAGRPAYVFDRQGYFGRDLVSEDEFKRGLSVRVYRVRGMPPRFLVIKVSQDKETILEARIEIS